MQPKSATVTINLNDKIKRFGGGFVMMGDSSETLNECIEDAVKIRKGETDVTPEEIVDRLAELKEEGGSSVAMTYGDAFLQALIPHDMDKQGRQLKKAVSRNRRKKLNILLRKIEGEDEMECDENTLVDLLSLCEDCYGLAPGGGQVVLARITALIDNKIEEMRSHDKIRALPNQERDEEEDEDEPDTDVEADSEG